MTQPFYSKKSFAGIPTALFLLMLVFFFVPFAVRGARMALQKTENNVKDWLPSDFRETEELAWFAKRFVSEQFVIATWDGCTEDADKLRLFVSKLHKEQLPDAESDPELYRAKQLGAELALFAEEELHANWGGRQEKWLIDEHGRRYYITPAGRLYRWAGKPNIVSAAWRSFARSTGSFQLDGQFVAAFGSPSTDSKPNRFWDNPRLLTAPLLKTVETGPDLIRQLAGTPDAPLHVPSSPIVGERMALGRLTGTLFGPPVPADFDWSAKQLKNIVSETTLAELPDGWEESWATVLQEHLDDDYEGQLENLCKASPKDQAEVWFDFFDQIAIDVPPRQTCVKLTLTPEAARSQARLLGRGVLGQPVGRLFEIARDCGINPPPKPSMAPPPFSWLAAKTMPKEPVIRIGGPPVDNVAIDEEGTITLVRLIGYSLALGLVLSYLCLRSLRLMIMVFFVGGTSAMASLGFVWWCNASIDAILLTMPSLIYVLGMAGAIHIVNYYRDAVIEHGTENAPERAITHAVMPCTLAAITTAIGLLSLCASNILPIRKFGIFSAMGIMATLVLLYIYLPSALTIFPPKVKSAKAAANDAAAGILKFWEAIGRFILRWHWFVNAACVCAFIGLGLGLFKIQTSVQLLKLFDANSQIIQDYGWLEQNFGRLVPMELVVRFPKELQQPSDAKDLQSTDERRLARVQMTMLDRADAVNKIQDVLQKKFGYAGEDKIGQGMSVMTFLQNVPEPWQGFTPQRSGANLLLQEQRDELLNTDYLAIEQSPDAEGTELWRISMRLGALNNVDYGRFVHSLRDAVQPVIAGYRCRQDVLRKILERYPDQADGIKGRVLFLGLDETKPGTDIESPSDAIEDFASQELLSRTTREPIAVTDEDMRLLARTLSSGLVNQTIQKIYRHDPTHKPLDKDMAISEQWAQYLQKFDCVVLINPHKDYDLDFVKGANANFIDAHQMLQEMKNNAQAPRVAGGQPVEMSEFPGEMDIVYTGIVPVVYKAQRTLLESLIESVAWAFGLIAFVMACLLSPAKNFFEAFRPGNLLQAIGSGALSMIPNVFPVVIIFGIMGHLGTLVDIGSMMTASVAMGVAVDDTIHFLTWFRDGLRRGLDRRDAIFVAYKHVAPAMTQTTIIGGLGLSVFALSTFTPTQRFGTLMLALLCAALVGDLIFLPALLASPLGKIFSFRRSGKPPEDNSSIESDEYRLAAEDPTSMASPMASDLIGNESQAPENAVPAPKMLSRKTQQPRRL